MATTGNIIRVRMGENPTKLQIRRTGNFNDQSRLRTNDTRPLVEMVALRVASIQIPDMVDIPGMANKKIMMGEVSIDLFRRVMEGCDISGNNAELFRMILDKPAEENKALYYASLFDARNFANRLSSLTGRSFRVQTEGEWEAARPLLTGNNWTWTETPDRKTFMFRLVYGYFDWPWAKTPCYQDFVLRRTMFDGRSSFNPELRVLDRAIRLVEECVS